MILKATSEKGKGLIVMNLQEAEAAGFSHAEFADHLQRLGIIDNDGTPEDALWPIAIIIQAAGCKPSGSNPHLDNEVELTDAYRASNEFNEFLTDARVDIDFNLTDILGEKG
jgi:hypothetical protein